MPGSGPPTTADAAAARAALASVVPRLTALIRSIRNPAAPAVGEWNAGDVAVHLAHAWELLPALARGDMGSPLHQPDELAGVTTAMVQREPARELEAIAGRIEEAASDYLATPMTDNGARPWMIEGTTLPSSAFSCHLLNESLVHGYDIAHAEGRRWHIDPAHAGMAIMGFAIPALSVVDPRFPVDQRHAAGVRACFDIRVRRTGRFCLVFDDGALTVEAPGERPADWHISAEPATLLLLLWSRTSPWPGMLSGRLRVWGRRPLLGMRLTRMMRNP
ncbi:MAG: SCP2 sterol-binding domain-containing protein [Chloroflexi bacterium]|nr:MAG: SCP2 sterol-binding domain-containing protein [Chloroflexota bacterium]